jgi:hypothetical protein
MKMNLIKFYTNLFEGIFDVFFKMCFIIFILINIIFILSPIILLIKFNQPFWLLGLIITLPYAISFIGYLKE